MFRCFSVIGLLSLIACGESEEEKTNPEPPKAAPAPKPLEDKEKKPKVDFAKKMSVQKAKRVGASDLKIPLQQQSSGGSTGGLNV